MPRPSTPRFSASSLSMRAIATADVEHARARRHHLGD
jgi:hypothetical protein